MAMMIADIPPGVESLRFPTSAPTPPHASEVDSSLQTKLPGGGFD
jgi:hypothetical protein